MAEKRRLMKEKAEIYLDWYREIFIEIELYGSEMMFAILRYLRNGSQVFEFRGHELGIKEFLGMVVQYNDRPEKLEVLMQEGKSVKVAAEFVGIAEHFLGGLPYVSYLPAIPEIDG
ncbi:MAG: hypothetical protein AAB487_03520 [Patescibacteria group bacterium]